MAGLTIGAWSHLPIEAGRRVANVSFTTVIGYEVVKIWLATASARLRRFWRAVALMACDHMQCTPSCPAHPFAKTAD